MTNVLSLIFAAAQHLDSSCTDCWNRAVRFGRHDLLEVCVRTATRHWLKHWKVQAEKACETLSGTGTTTKQSRERLHQFCLREKAETRLDTFGSLHLVEFLEYHHNGCPVFWKELQPWFRECKHLAVTFTLHNHSAHPVGREDESSRPRLGLARLTRKSTEPILAIFDHISRRSTSAEPSNLRQETQTRQTL